MGISLYGLTPATTYDALIKTGDNAPIDATLKPLSDGVGTNLPMEASTTGINFTGSLLQGGVAVPTAAQVSAKQDTLVSGTNIKTINGTSVLGSGNIVTPTTSPSGVSGAIQFSNGSAFASDAANLFWDDTNNRLGVGTNAPNHLTEFLGAGMSIPSSITSPVNLFLSSNFSGAGLKLGLGTIQSTQGGGAGTTSFALNINPFGGNVSINSTTNLGAQLGIKGSGSTSATTSLLVQNSAGNTALQILDDRSFVVGNFGANGAGLGILAGNPTGAGVGGGINFNFNNGAAFNDDTNNSALKITYNGGVRIPNSSRYPLTLGSDTKAVASAQLEMVSTTQGFLPPRMTTTQKNAIASPAAGLVVYDSTTNKLCCYNGSTWNDLF